MEDLSEKINEIERLRQRRLYWYSLLSLLSTILVVSTSIMSSINGQIKIFPGTLITVACAVMATLDTGIEYLVRRRIFLIQGPSMHLIEMYKHISILHEILENFRKMVSEPVLDLDKLRKHLSDNEITFSTRHYIAQIIDAYEEQTKMITFAESKKIVIAKT